LIIYKNNKKTRRYSYVLHTRWRLKMPFYDVVKSTAAFFFYWCDMCQCWRDDLLLKCLFFFYLFPWKLQLNIICCWYFNFSSYSFDFLIFILGFFIEVLFVFNFIFQSQFIIYYFFQFDSCSFDFFEPFVKLIFLFNFIFQ